MLFHGSTVSPISALSHSLLQSHNLLQAIMALRVPQLGSVSSCSPRVWWHRDFRSTYRSSAKPLQHPMAHFSQHPTDFTFYIALSQNIVPAAIDGKSPSFSCNFLPTSTFSLCIFRKLKITKMIFITWYWVSFVLYCPYFSKENSHAVFLTFGEFKAKPPPAVTLQFSCKCYIFTWHYVQPNQNYCILILMP